MVVWTHCYLELFLLRRRLSFFFTFLFFGTSHWSKGGGGAAVPRSVDYNYLANNSIMAAAAGLVDAPGDPRLSGDTAGMPFVTVTIEEASVTVYLHGAHVSSWMYKGEEMLFMSEQAVYNGSKALRGGVPICFPQFGDLGPVKAQHGFARNLPWTLVEKVQTPGSAMVRLSLFTMQPESEWPHPYVLTNTVTISAGGKLTQELSVMNPGAGPFTFTTALHTYFRVAASGAKVTGLLGKTYLDSLDGRASKQDAAETVVFPGEVDRIYMDVPRTVTVSDSKRLFQIDTNEEFADAIVWNPFIDKAKRMGDYGDDEWKLHVCHEVARTGQPVTLAPGKMWTGKQEITASAL